MRLIITGCSGTIVVDVAICFLSKCVPKVYFRKTKCKVNCTSNLTYLERSSDLDILGMI